MATLSQEVLAGEAAAQKPWSPGTRIAFRFCFVYFTLYSVTCQIVTSWLPWPNEDLPDLSKPMRPLISWVAAHLFDVKAALVFDGSGSGDKIGDWVLAFCLLVVAFAAAAVWTWVDTKRKNYSSFYRWLRLFMRFALAGQMLTYGFAKAVPLQMPFPRLQTLIEPYGDLSPMGVLWSSIGASPVYESFTGCVEILGGLLLLAPRTTVVGALLSFVAMWEVFMLNMTYDIPVKLLSFHLVCFALFLLAPDLLRIVKFVFLRDDVEPLPNRQLFATRRANRIALAAQLVFGLWLVGVNAYGDWDGWHQYGGGRAHSPLYGIWNIDQLVIDGKDRPPLMTDSERLRRVIFDGVSYASFEKMDGTKTRFASSLDTKKQTLTLTAHDPAKAKVTSNFSYQRPEKEQLILDGEFEERKFHMALKRVDEKKFLLIQRGFHWVQEYPFNR